MVFALSNIVSCDKAARLRKIQLLGYRRGVTETTGYADSVAAISGAKFRTLQQNPGLLYNFYTDRRTALPTTSYSPDTNNEERLNIDVVETACFVFGINKLQKSVLSGSDEYDLVLNQIFGRLGRDTGSCGWAISYINLSEPWYTKSIRTLRSAAVFI